MENNDVKIRENGIMNRMTKLYIALIVFASVAELYHACLDETAMSYRLATAIIIWIFFIIVLLVSYLYVWVRARTEKSGIRESLILWLLAIAIITMIYVTYLLIIQTPSPEERFWQMLAYDVDKINLTSISRWNGM